MVPWGCLRYVIVVYPDHSHQLFLTQSLIKFILFGIFSFKNTRLTLYLHIVFWIEKDQYLNMFKYVIFIIFQCKK